MASGCFYIMANRKNGTLYCGSTRDMGARDHEHKSLANPKSFTARYGCTILVHVEFFDDLMDAVARENAVKRWKRSWKIALIDAENPDWRNIELDAIDLDPH